MGATGYFTHADCRLHEMGKGHPECPQRLDAIEDRLLITGLDHALERREPAPAFLADIELAHGRMYVASLRGLSDALIEDMQAGGPSHTALDPDTSMNSHTWKAALRSAGAALEATDAVIAGELENAFCAVRPPGHHACRDKAMGFCFFNNVAIAAKYALERHGLQRVAIVAIVVAVGVQVIPAVALQQGTAAIAACHLFFSAVAVANVAAVLDQLAHQSATAQVGVAVVVGLVAVQVVACA